MEGSALTERKAEKGFAAAQQAEASARLGILEGMGLDPSAKRAFDEGRRICFDGAVDTVLGAVRLKCLLAGDFPTSRSGKPLFDEVAEFEAKTGALVYFATHEFTAFGELLDLFYVSPDEEDDWGEERRMLSEGLAYAKVCNLDDDMMSDFGMIGFDVSEGGIARTM